MFGAIFGDVVGSRLEFDNCKSKEFGLFVRECGYTDDTVMTLAVAKALLPYETITDLAAFKNELVRVMHEVGIRYPAVATAGSIAEAYYGVDREMKDTALSYLDYDLMDIAEEFGRKFVRVEK